MSRNHFMIHNLTGRKDFNDIEVLKILNSLFINKRGTPFKPPKKGSSVILILSGGMDSCCLWFLLMKKYGLTVYPIHFKRTAQTNKGQLTSIRYYSRLFRRLFPDRFREVLYETADRSFVMGNSPQIGYNVLKHDLSYIVQNSVYKNVTQQFGTRLLQDPIRLVRYALKGYEYGLFIRQKYKEAVSSVFLGIIPEDSRLCRESTLALIRTVNLYLCTLVGDFKWQFCAPIDREGGFYYPKGSLAQFAIRNSIPLEYTWSCGTSKSDSQCGVCFQCRSRRAVFEELGVGDKTKYQRFTINKHVRKYAKRWRSIIPLFVKKVPVQSEFSRDVPIKINPEVLSAEISQHIWVLSKHDGYLEELNDEGSYLWRQIESKKPTYKKLLILFRNKYALSQRQSEKDLTAFLTTNLQRKVLVQTK